MVGWLCFAIAAVTYLLTIEPTTSLWDCGEFIATGYKLEIGHAPGNPVFLLIARFFTMFAFGNVSIVAMMVNAMSAICSALTILLLFWTITHLARKLVTSKGMELNLGSILAILGAGAIGALAYTYTDTFWFSAVEGEVYGMSSLCTAATFWVILKWEDRADEPYGNRWIILMGFIIGLAIGVHLLNLLTIPAVGMVYYYKKYNPTWKGGIVAFGVSCLIVLLAMMMIPGIPTIASWFELLFVNSFGLPFNSGTAFGFLTIAVFLFWTCFYTWRKRRVLLNTIMLFITVIAIGYSAYALIIIRSAANPPINEGAPDNVFSFISYLNRDQYGSAPLLRGQTYATEPVGYKQSWVFTKKDGRYVRIPSTSYEFDSNGMMLFPRVHSSGHIEEYIKWANIRPAIVSEQQVWQYLDSQGRKKVQGHLRALSDSEVYAKRLPRDQRWYQFTPPPTMSENLRFLFSYQLNWMYWRYFFWNFAGRQNDVQGHGDPMYGNWISGFKGLDNARIKWLQDQPDFLKNNKANNSYYMIPFILGLIGFCYQLMKDKRQWLIVFLLFFFTGIAIVLYLNQTPLQPRERDYAYAGSFYAYAIWIGFAVLAFYDLLQNAVKNVRNIKNKSVISAAVATALCLPAPILLATQNWDDHDRSHRYMARDIAYNYLMSCDPNAILFTVGDNDTFPLWYLQEVEGIRTDVRVANLSLLAADWYIDQMKYRTYESAPLPITLSREAYLGERNNMVEVRATSSEPVLLKAAISAINKAGDNAYLPTKSYLLPVSRENVLSTGLVKEAAAEYIQDTIVFTIDKSYIIKPQLIMYDILANSDWKRPLHFTTTAGESNIGLRDYLQYNGFTYKLIPIKTAAKPNDMVVGRVETEWLYDYLMNTCRWGNMEKPSVYVDYFFITTLVRILNVRGMYATLANNLIAEGDIERAKPVLDRVMEIMPQENFPYSIGFYLNDVTMSVIVDAFYRTGQKERADALAEKLSAELEKNLMYFGKFEGMELSSTLYAMEALYHVAVEHGNTAVQSKLKHYLEAYKFI